MGEEATKTIQTRLHVASGKRSWLHDARLASREIFNDTIRLKQQGYTRTEIQKEVDRDDFLRNNKCAVVGKASKHGTPTNPSLSGGTNKATQMEGNQRHRVRTNPVRTRL
nr:hypothetical protein [Halegenticoccus soli]